jgi:hypothetical protein
MLLSLVGTWTFFWKRDRPLQCGNVNHKKYTKIFVSAIAWKNKFKHIHAPSGVWLCRTIKKFKDITIIQNMIGCIDSCHVPLDEQFDKRKNTWNKGFFQPKKKFILYYYKLFVILINCFGMFIGSSLVDVLMVKHLSFQFYIIICKINWFCKNKCFPNMLLMSFPYIVGDFTYLVHPYLLKNFKSQNPTLEMEKNLI